MRHVKLLSFDEFSSRRELLDQAHYAEGSWGWFKTLASTTLTDREKPVFAVAFDETGEVRAVLPLAVTANRSLRSLTAPYTTLYAPALHNLDWARYLGEQAASYVANSMRLDALDLEDMGIKAYLAGLN